MLVGREHERRLLTHLLADARDGHAALVLVWGVPGAGKTALLRWLATTASAEASALVLRTGGDAWSAPFAAMRRLVGPVPELAEAVARRMAGASEDLVGATSPRPGRTIGHADGAAALAVEIADGLAARAHRRPLVLLVDDAHHLAPASAGVLEQVLVELTKVLS